MSNLILVAPLAGWSTPLDEAPDAVFAGRMLGDGLAIDPTGSTLYAPCDGELIAVPASRHAITLRTPEGAEILLHVGIDTVALDGEGFELHVQQGQRVRAGDRLLSFDIDLLARRAKSVLTPVIVLEGGGFTVARRSENREVAVGDLLMELVPEKAAAQAASGPGPVLSRRVLVALEHGIHARPAALLAGAVKGFTAEVTLVARGREANARSTVALMTLGVRKGDEVEIRASGSDAEAALSAAEAALSRENGQMPASTRGPGAASGAASAAERLTPPDSNIALPREDNILRGAIASRGLTLGYTLQLSRPEISVPENGAGISHESAELDRARSVVTAHLKAAAGSGPRATREIMGAHLELLDDPELVAGARVFIENGKSAGYAWRQVIRATVEVLRGLNDARMA